MHLFSVTVWRMAVFCRLFRLARCSLGSVHCRRPVCVQAARAWCTVCVRGLSGRCIVGRGLHCSGAVDRGRRARRSTAAVAFPALGAHCNPSARSSLPLHCRVSTLQPPLRLDMPRSNRKRPAAAVAAAAAAATATAPALPASVAAPLPTVNDSLPVVRPPAGHQLSFSIDNPFGLGDPLSGPPDHLRPPALRGRVELMDLGSWVRVVERSDPAWFAGRTVDERAIWETWKYSSWMDRMVEYRTTERVAGIMHRAALQHAYTLMGTGSASSGCGHSSSAAPNARAPGTWTTDCQNAQDHQAANILLLANAINTTGAGPKHEPTLPLAPSARPPCHSATAPPAP